MTIWDRLIKKKNNSIESRTIVNPSQSDRELVMNWIRSINESISSLKLEIHRIPMLTVSEFNENFEDKSDEVIKKLDGLPGKITAPLKELINLSKQEILTKLIRISAHYDAHDSNDSVSAPTRAIEMSIKEISKELTGKQKRLLALLLDSGFLSYSEIGEKLGITHESAKNFVNRLLKDGEKARLFSKQETDEGIKVGVSDKIQDEILKKRYRTTSNDSI